jgi:tetratricopeptide (TPR) repeat protein
LSIRILRHTWPEIQVAYGAVAGIYFLLTPINMSTAAYAYGLSDILATCLIFLALHAHILRAKRPILGSIGMLSALLVGLGTKQTCVIIPALLILYDLIFPCQINIRLLFSRWRSYLPAFLLVLLYFFLRYIRLGGVGDLEGTSHLKPWLQYVCAQPYAILHYIVGSLIPSGLSIDHDLASPFVQPIPFIEAAFFLSLLIGISVWFTARKTPEKKIVLFSICFFILMILPISSFLPTVDYMVDRRAYGANAGLAVMLALGLGHIQKSRKDLWRQAMCILMMAVYLVFLAVSSHQRIALLNSKIAPWLEVLERYPASSRAIINLGVAYTENKQYPEAKAIFERGLVIFPNHVDILFNYGILFLDNASPFRDRQRAESIYQKVAFLEPTRADTYVNLGYLRGSTEEAVQFYRHAISLRADYVQAYLNLGEVFIHLGKYEESKNVFERILTLDPNNILALGGIGVIYDRQNNLVEAERIMLGILNRTPLEASAYYNLGSLYLRWPRLKEALVLLEKAVTLDPKMGLAWINIGVLHERQNELNLAEFTYRKAIALQPDFAEAYLSLGKILFRLGDKVGTLESIKKALALAPDLRSSARSIVWALASSADPKLRDVKSALTLSTLLWPKGAKGDPYDLLVFAATQAGSGHIIEARHSALAALAIGRAQGEKRLIEMTTALLTALDKGLAFVY